MIMGAYVCLVYIVRMQVSQKIPLKLSVAQMMVQINTKHEPNMCMIQKLLTPGIFIFSIVVQYELKDQRQVPKM